ncbi:MAG TPA: purine-nucleoside phosphorylase [Gemmatimonadaceae bacterium]|jgi:purine-nucleoside phosphorylase
MTLAAPAVPAAPSEAPGLQVFEAAEDAARVIRRRFSARPDAAIILGTGLGRLAMEIENPVAIPYEDIPGFPASTVESHAGRLLCGTLGARTVIAMQGRFHRYEGYSLQQVTFPVRVLRALGADTLFVSNACGGLNPLWNAGDLMLITDHVNLLGDSPLIGPNDDRLGPRFPDMSAPYDPALGALARRVAADEGIGLREGVYVAVVGPNLETRAEYRFLRAIGADVVGMSTVPETIVAVHSGMRVLGLSIITDMCDPEALEPATVEQIIAVANRAEPALTTLVRRVLERM